MIRIFCLSCIPDQKHAIQNFPLFYRIFSRKLVDGWWWWCLRVVERAHFHWPFFGSNQHAIAPCAATTKQFSSCHHRPSRRSHRSWGRSVPIVCSKVFFCTVKHTRTFYFISLTGGENDHHRISISIWIKCTVFVFICVASSTNWCCVVRAKRTFCCTRVPCVRAC